MYPRPWTSVLGTCSNDQTYCVPAIQGLWSMGGAAGADRMGWTCRALDELDRKDDRKVERKAGRKDGGKTGRREGRRTDKKAEDEVGRKVDM